MLDCAPMERKGTQPRSLLGVLAVDAGLAAAAGSTVTTERGEVLDRPEPIQVPRPQPEPEPDPRVQTRERGEAIAPPTKPSPPPPPPPDVITKERGEAILESSTL